MNGEGFARLVALAQTGDPGALAGIWQRHNPALERYLVAGAGLDGQDLASVVWLEVARQLGQFSGDESSFRAYLFTVARHRLLDWNRQLQKERVVPVSNLADRSSGDDPAVLVVEAEATDKAVAIINQLPPAQAEVLLLRLIAGLDVAETATALGQRSGTVRVLQHRALRSLAEALEREPTEDR